jgi:hypothetical protein
MKLIRTIARVVATALWFLFGGALGAMIAVMSALWFHGYLSRDEPLGAAGAMFGAALLGAFAPLGYLAGSLCALVLWGWWSIQDKPEP